MKNKDVEDYVFETLEFFEKQRDPAIDQITKEAFAAHRKEGFDEVTIKRLNTYLEIKDKEILEHKLAISNLRGYIGYLESQIHQLEVRIGEHEDSY